MSHRLSFYAILVSVLIGLTLSSCGSSRTVTTASSGGKGSKTTVRRPPVSGLDPAARTLVREAESWVGTPYRYGGNDRGGVDCSGLVTQVYMNAFGIKLPRTSREQMDFCQNVDKSRLTPGDLLFFRTSRGSKKVSHVGIFVGENQMIHSSTSQGVIYTDINSDYYSRTFAGAGRVGQYHAMLDNKAAKTKPVKPDRNRDKKTDGKEIVKEDKNGVETAGFTLAPVEALPSRSAQTVEAPKPEVKEKPIGPVRVTSVKQPANPQPATTAEPTPEDARAAVLNSIVEKPIK